MKRHDLTAFALAMSLIAFSTLIGCDDDDNEVRDQHDGAYYEQNPNYRGDRSVYYGEHGGVTVDVRRQGDRDDDDDWDDDDRRRYENRNQYDDDDDDDDDRRRQYYDNRRNDDDDDDDNDDWDDDD